MGIEGDNIRYSVKENFSKEVAFGLGLKDKFVTCSGTTESPCGFSTVSKEENGMRQSQSSAHP